jgi:hypothetical protein
MMSARKLVGRLYMGREVVLMLVLLCGNINVGVFEGKE